MPLGSSRPQERLIWAWPGTQMASQMAECDKGDIRPWEEEEGEEEEEEKKEEEESPGAVLLGVLVLDEPSVPGLQVDV